MKEQEFRVIVPEGYEIDKEKSTFECIKFKPIKSKKWREDTKANFEGYYINNYSVILYQNNVSNVVTNDNVFATKRQAKSALAMARISQIMANDKRFGGVVTDEEWEIESYKYVIERINNSISIDWYTSTYRFLAFHTTEQRDLFLKENEDLVKDYLMIE